MSEIEEERNKKLKRDARDKFKWDDDDVEEKHPKEKKIKLDKKKYKKFDFDA